MKSMEFDSELIASTLTYPLPIVKSGQKTDMKCGQENSLSEVTSNDIQGSNKNEELDKSGRKDIPKSGQKTNVKSGQKQNSRKDGYRSGIDTREKIVDAMRNNPEVSRHELSNLLNISPSAIQRHINFLKENGVIIRLGSDKKGLWKVIK